VRKFFLLIIFTLLLVTIVFAYEPIHQTPAVRPEHPDANHDITAHPQGARDLDGSDFSNITDWRVDGAAYAVFNAPLDVITNGQTKDFSINGNDLVVTGPVINISGGHDGGSAMVFNGIEDAINTTGFTDDVYAFSFWINPRETYSSSSEAAYTLDLQDSATASIYELVAFGPCCSDVSSESFSLVHDGAAGRGRTSVQSFTFSPGNWYHLGARWNATAGKYQVYINGIERSTTSGGVAHTQLFTGANKVHIGKSRLNSAPFNGSIDEVLLFGQTISEEQLLSIYENGFAKIVSDETTSGENWTACVTLADGESLSKTKCAEAIIQTNSPPTGGTATLTPFNPGTNQNLSVEMSGVEDSNDQSIKNMVDWRESGTSLAVLNMPLEGDTGSAVMDVSTYENNGSFISSPTYVPTGGADGGGYYNFDGIDDEIRVADADELDVFGDDDFSLSLWVNFDSFDTDGSTLDTIAQKRNLDDRNWLHYNGGSHVVTHNLKDQGGNSSGMSIGADNFTIGKWHHIVISINGSDTSGHKFYLDNTLMATSNPVPVGDLSNSDPWHFGSSTGAIRYFNGSIDEIKMYKFPLSAEQVTALYNHRDIVVSSYTTTGEVYQACVTPNDYFAPGSEVCSNTVQITSSTGPTIGGVTISSELDAFTTNEDLSATSNGVEDTDSSLVKNITDWRLNGNSIAILNAPLEGGSNSSTTYDHSTSKYAAAVNNAVYNATGGYDGNGAYFFDGTDDNISFGDIDELDSASQFTVVGWAKQDTLDVRAGLWSKTDGGSFSRVDAVTWDDGGLYFDFGTGAANAWSSIADYSAVVSAGEWFHFAFVFNGSATGGNDHRKKIYVDGVSQSLTHSGTTPATSQDIAGLFIIGEYGNDANPTADWNGYLDEIKIYNFSLTPDQIAKLAAGSDDISSDETNTGETWTACVSPSDGTTSGEARCVSETIRSQEVSTYNTIGGSPVSASWATITSGSGTLVRSGTPYEWSWRGYSPDSGRLVPRGGPTNWSWGPE
jgi:hypothetical protein